jgi:NSS family neurotransmitter:Na+ symporter
LKITGKILIVTVIVPYLFFIVLMVKGFFLSGSELGIKYLLEPDWSKLLGTKVIVSITQIWIDAIVQVFFQTSISSAGLLNYSSKKPKRQ